MTINALAAFQEIAFNMGDIGKWTLTHVRFHGSRHLEIEFDIEGSMLTVDLHHTGDKLDMIVRNYPENDSCGDGGPTLTTLREFDWTKKPNAR